MEQKPNIFTIFSRLDYNYLQNLTTRSKYMIKIKLLKLLFIKQNIEYISAIVHH